MKLTWLLKLALVALLLLLGYGGWTLERYINYRWSYQSLVQDEVRRLVRPECLEETRASSSTETAPP